jgi:hypothetical protein
MSGGFSFVSRWVGTDSWCNQAIALYTVNSYLRVRNGLLRTVVEETDTLKSDSTGGVAVSIASRFAHRPPCVGRSSAVRTSA